MKFNHPSDTKAFAIGVVASIFGVILWDIIKYNFHLLEYSSNSNKLKLFKGFDMNSWKYTPPPNKESSLKEIEDLLKNPINEPSVRKYDQVSNQFNKLLLANNKILDNVQANLINKELDHIVSELKNHYNRPRPKDIKPIEYLDLESANTPSYPSGHSLQARLLALIYGKKYPELKPQLEKLGEVIGQSRLNARVHYLSDHVFGKKIANDLFNKYKSNQT